MYLLISSVNSSNNRYLRIIVILYNFTAGETHGRHVDVQFGFLVILHGVAGGFRRSLDDFDLRTSVHVFVLRNWARLDQSRSPVDAGHAVFRRRHGLPTSLQHPRRFLQPLQHPLHVIVVAVVVVARGRRRRLYAIFFGVVGAGRRTVGRGLVGAWPLQPLPFLLSATAAAAVVIVVVRQNDVPHAFHPLGAHHQPAASRFPAEKLARVRGAFHRGNRIWKQWLCYITFCMRVRVVYISCHRNANWTVCIWIWNRRTYFIGIYATATVDNPFLPSWNQRLFDMHAMPPSALSLSPPLYTYSRPAFYFHQNVYHCRRDVGRF